MFGEIILGVVIGLPVLLGIVFRTNTSYIFFSLMTGELLGRYFGHDLDHLAETQLNTSVYNGYGEILLIAVPVILTAYILRGSIPPGKVPIHTIPLIVTGIICAAFVLPILPEGPQAAVAEIPAGDWLIHLNKVIVGALLIVQLLSLWVINHIKHRRAVKNSANS